MKNKNVLSIYLRGNGITREEFAERLGVHVGTINMLCGPNPRGCSASTALKIFAEIGDAVSTEDLLDPLGADGLRASERRAGAMGAQSANK